MRTAVKNIFGSIAGAALLASPMPAFSQDAPANRNVAASSFDARDYPYMDISSARPQLALDGVERNSTNRVVITFWASDDPQWNRIWSELERTADRLFAEGVPVSLYRAADLDHIGNDSSISIHSNGEERSFSTVFPRSSDIEGTTFAEGLRTAADLNPQLALLNYQAN